MSFRRFFCCYGRVQVIPVIVILLLCYFDILILGSTSEDEVEKENSLILNMAFQEHDRLPFPDSRFSTHTCTGS